MGFQKNDARINRSGRKEGSQNKVRKLTNDERIALVNHGNLTPLIFLQSVVMDEEQDTATRVKAAGEAAPYLHRKKPIAIEGGERPLMLTSPEQLASMNDDQLTALNIALIAIGAGLENSDKSED